MHPQTVTAMNSSLRSPQLPAEIWRMVFGHFGIADEDLVQLWLDCRHVSKLFKSAVEYRFTTDHVPKTLLWIGNGRSLQIDSRRIIATYLTPAQKILSIVIAQQLKESVSLGKVLHMMQSLSSSGSQSMAIELSSAILWRLASLRMIWTLCLRL